MNIFQGFCPRIDWRDFTYGFRHLINELFTRARNVDDTTSCPRLPGC